MSRFFTVAMVCIFMLLNAGYSHAGLFARGGGESRTISSITPSAVFNNAGGSLTLNGQFSGHQSRDRRVVIYGRRTHHGIRGHTVQQLQAATPTIQVVRPVRVTHWGGRRIQVIIPAHLTPGTYYIYIERNFGHHGQHQWRSISNKKTFEVKAARAMGQIRGSWGSSICNAPLQKLIITGGPFERSGRALNIHAEIQTLGHTDASSLRRIEVKSNTRIVMEIAPCVTIKRGSRLRLLYPGGTKSNWISIEQMWAR